MFARRTRATNLVRKMSLTRSTLGDRDYPEAYSEFPLPTAEQLDNVRKAEAEQYGFGSGRWLVVDDIVTA